MSGTGATRELVDRWVEGWGLSRDILRERRGRAWVVEVAAASRACEYVIAEPTPGEVDELVGLVAARPDHWLTVVGGPDARIATALSSLDRVTVDEMMMISAIPADSSPDAATEVLIEERGAVAHARIERDGEVAAVGQAALSGTDVVFDRIETSPRFRRRGLGSLVMAGLTSWAAERGAQTGLLMASDQGRPLYRGLGWGDVAPLATYRGVPG